MEVVCRGAQRDWNDVNHLPSDDREKRGESATPVLPNNSSGATNPTLLSCAGRGLRETPFCKLLK